MLLLWRELFIIEKFDHVKSFPEEYLHGRVRMKRDKDELTKKGTKSCFQGMNAPERVIVGDELRHYPALRDRLEMHNRIAYYCTTLCATLLTAKCVRRLSRVCLY